MSDDLAREFKAGLTRAGIAVEPDRMAAMLEGFAGYRELAALLDEEPPLDLDPAGLYVPAPGGRT